MKKDLNDRWRQNNILQKETVDDWTLHTGDYGDEQLIESDSIDRSDYLTIRRKEYGDDLLGTEKHFASLIRQMLENKRVRKPFIVLDIGGMNGVSWLRLADEFEDEVKSSKIAFVVSNLKLVPGSNTENSSLFGHNPSYNREYINNSRMKKNVHYLQANLRQLRRMSVSFPNGKRLRLSGNCAFVHESNSVSSWSIVPELEVSRIPRLISEGGMYISPSLEPRGEYMGNDVQKKYFQQRREGLIKARSLFVKKYGLRRVTKVEKGKLKGDNVKASVYINGDSLFDL